MHKTGLKHLAANEKFEESSVFENTKLLTMKNN